MKQMKIILLAVVILAAIAAGYVWLFIWNKPQTNVEQAKGIQVEAKLLFQAYSSNEQQANAAYLEKIVEVTGEVKTVTRNAEGFMVVLLKTDDPMFGINCTLEQNEVVMKEGETVTLKGICTGYLTDVVVIRCIVIKKQ
jgi:Flp pilus assembly protein CpaB